MGQLCVTLSVKLWTQRLRPTNVLHFIKCRERSASVWYLLRCRHRVTQVILLEVEKVRTLILCQAWEHCIIEVTRVLDWQARRQKITTQC